ncbi:hypothetical protein KUTeg_013923, partial [Tegillarca granosa]
MVYCSMVNVYCCLDNYFVIHVYDIPFVNNIQRESFIYLSFLFLLWFHQVNNSGKKFFYMYRFLFTFCDV